MLTEGAWAEVRVWHRTPAALLRAQRSGRSALSDRYPLARGGSSVEHALSMYRGFRSLRPMANSIAANHPRIREQGNNATALSNDVPEGPSAGVRLGRSAG